MVSSYGNFVMMGSECKEGSVNEITKTKYTVGTNGKCDLKLDSNSQKELQISCNVVNDGKDSKIVLTNNSESGLTKINKKVMKNGQKINLYNGDIVNIGSYYLKYQSSKPAGKGSGNNSIILKRDYKKPPTPIYKHLRKSNDSTFLSIKSKFNSNKKSLKSLNGRNSSASRDRLVTSTPKSNKSVTGESKGKLLLTIPPERFYSKESRLNQSKDISYYRKKIQGINDSDKKNENNMESLHETLNSSKDTLNGDSMKVNVDSESGNKSISESYDISDDSMSEEVILPSNSKRKIWNKSSMSVIIGSMNTRSMKKKKNQSMIHLDYKNNSVNNSKTNVSTKHSPSVKKFKKIFNKESKSMIVEKKDKPKFDLSKTYAFEGHNDDVSGLKKTDVLGDRRNTYSINRATLDDFSVDYNGLSQFKEKGKDLINNDCEKIEKENCSITNPYQENLIDDDDDLVITKIVDRSIEKINEKDVNRDFVITIDNSLDPSLANISCINDNVNFPIMEDIDSTSKNDIDANIKDSENVITEEINSTTNKDIGSSMKDSENVENTPRRSNRPSRKPTRFSLGTNLTKKNTPKKSKINKTIDIALSNSIPVAFFPPSAFKDGTFESFCKNASSAYNISNVMNNSNNTPIKRKNVSSKSLFFENTNTTNYKNFRKSTGSIEKNEIQLDNNNLHNKDNSIISLPDSPNHPSNYEFVSPLKKLYTSDLQIDSASQSHNTDNILITSTPISKRKSIRNSFNESSLSSKIQKSFNNSTVYDNVDNVPISVLKDFYAKYSRKLLKKINNSTQAKSTSDSSSVKSVFKTNSVSIKKSVVFDLGNNEVKILPKLRSKITRMNTRKNTNVKESKSRSTKKQESKSIPMIKKSKVIQKSRNSPRLKSKTDNLEKEDIVETVKSSRTLKKKTVKSESIRKNNTDESIPSKVKNSNKSTKKNTKSTADASDKPEINKSGGKTRSTRSTKKVESTITVRRSSRLAKK